VRQVLQDHKVAMVTTEKQDRLDLLVQLGLEVQLVPLANMVLLDPLDQRELGVLKVPQGLLVKQERKDRTERRVRMVLQVLRVLKVPKVKLAAMAIVELQAQPEHKDQQV